MASIGVGLRIRRLHQAQRVAAQERIGTVAWPNIANGSYAHLHVQAHSRSDCTESDDAVAFDVAHGFAWACTPNLPYSGTANQYSGLALTRCKTPAVVQQRERSPRPIASINWICDLSNDNRRYHPRPIGQTMYSAVVGVFARFFECMTEAVSLP